MAISEFWGVPTDALGKLTAVDLESRKTRDLPENLVSRFTDEDRALYEAALCGNKVEYGTGGIGKWCGSVASAACTFGYCVACHEESEPPC